MKEEPLDLEIEPRILREFIKKHKKETTFTHTDVYESLEIFKKEIKKKVKSAVQGLIGSIKFNLYNEGWNDKQIEQFLDETVKYWFPNLVEK